MDKKSYILQLLKYFIMAVIVGIIVGAIDALFGRVLIAISDFRTIHYQYLLPFLPIAGLVITAMYYAFSKASLKGMKLVFEADSKNRCYPIIINSIGNDRDMVDAFIRRKCRKRRGCCPDWSDIISCNRKKIRIPREWKINVSDRYGSRIRRSVSDTTKCNFFAIEVIVIGKMDYEALLPALASAYTAAFTSHSLGLEKFSVVMKDTVNLSGTKTIAAVICLGIIFGLTGRLFSFSLSKLKAFMGEKIMNQFLRIGFMAIPLAVLLFAVYGSRYSGLGTNLISAGFTGQTIYGYDWILKLLFTIFTLAIGFQGGEVTPLFSIGTSLGVILGGLFGLPPMLCAALGYAAVLEVPQIH